MTEHRVDEVRRGLFRRDRSVNGHQMCHLAESVDKDKNTRAILTIGREPEDKVHRN